MSAKLYDNGAQSWTLIPDSDVQDAVASGSHSFEQGVDVPVITPQGEMKSVKGTGAQEAFNNGYRYATRADTDAWEKAGLAKSQDAIYGSNPDNGFASNVLGAASTVFPLAKLGELALNPNEAKAAAQGFMGGFTFGGSNVLERALGAPEDAQQALKEQNPYSYGVGMVAGSVLNPVGRAIGAVAGGMGKLAESTFGQFGGPAGKIVGGMLEGAPTGAFFGADDALNEASLGHAPDIAETLSTDMLSNAVFGMGLGGVGGVARSVAPWVAQKFGGVGGVMGKAAAKAAQIYTDLSTRPALAITGNSDKGFKELVHSPEARAAEAAGAMGKLAEGEAAYVQTVKEAGKRAEQMAADLQDHMEGLADDQQTAVNAAIKQNGGDLIKATQSIFDEQQLNRKALYDARMADPDTAGTIALDTHNATHELADTLTQEGGKPADVALGKSVRAFLDSRELVKGIPQVLEAQRAIPSDEAGEFAQTMFSHQISGAQEVDNAMELRATVQKALDGKSDFTAAGQRAMEKYVGDLTQQLHEHPQFGEYVQGIDRWNDVVDSLTDFLGTFGEKRLLQDPKNLVFKELVTNPAFRDRFGPFAEHLGDLIPELKNFHSAAENVALQREALDKMNAIMGRTNVNGFSMDDAQLFADALIDGRNAAGMPPTDLAERIANVREAQKLGAVGPVPPAAEWVRILRENNKAVPDNIDDLLPLEKGIRDMAAMRGSTETKEMSKIAQLLPYVKTLSKGLFAGAGFQYLGAPGMALGPLSSVASDMVGLLGNPKPYMVSKLDSLTRMEGWLKKVEPRVNGAVQSAIDSLTSTGGRSAVQATRAHLTEQPITRDKFADQAEYIQGIAADPSALHDDVMNKIGVIPDAPQISAAIIANYANRVQNVAQQFPKDPLAHQYISPRHSPWTPSDMQLASLNRYVAVAENPLTALKSITAGTAAPEEVLSLQQNYPRMWSRLQEGLASAIMDSDSDIPYGRRVQIGRMFGLVTDPSVSPQNVQSFQARLQAGGGGAQQKPDQGFGQPMHVRANPKVQFDPATTSTEIDRATYK